MTKQHRIIFIIVSITLMFVVSVATVIGVLISQNKQNSPSSSNDFIISEPIPADYNVGKNATIINGQIKYSNAGSSSCPPVAEKVEYDQSTNTYSIFVKQYNNQPCTADMRGLQQTIEHKDGTKISYSSNVRIVR